MTTAVNLLLEERAQLCNTLEKLGPQAPTLCKGWLAEDLAAHLMIREHDPLALPGMALPGPFSNYTKAAMEKAKQQGFDKLVSTLRQGPPLLYKLPGPLATANLVENWVHHEDLRRPAGEAPRDSSPELDMVLSRVIPIQLRLAVMRVKGVTIQAVLPDGRRTQSGKGIATVEIAGPVGELVLFLFGRGEAAQVSFDGPDYAVEAVRNGNFGI